MNFGREINVNELPDYDTSPVPAGWYTASITKSEVKDTKRGDGQYLSLQYSILGPTHQGRVVFSNITINNPSETATRIGLAQLKELVLAAGLDRISDSSQLVGATVQIRVTIRQDSKFGDVNDVRSWNAVTPRPAVSPFPAQPPVPQPPAPSLPEHPANPFPTAPHPMPRPVLPPWGAHK